MTILSRFRSRVGAIAVFAFVFCAFEAKAELTVQGYSPATAALYDRFLNDPSFIGSGYNWSGVGRGIAIAGDNSVIQTGGWGTMISPSYFISANHFSPAVIGANALRFYYTNNPAGGFEDHTFTSVGKIAGSDLWLGKLNTPVSSNVAKYPVMSIPSTPQTPFAGYGGLPLKIFGLSSASPGNDTSMRLGTNNIDLHNGLGSNLTPVVQANIGVIPNNSIGYTYTFDYTTGAGWGEAKLESGDSGAPNFYMVNGNMPAVIGINWYALTSPNGSGSTAVPEYLAPLQAAMTTESLSIVKNSAVLGDYNLDGQLSNADLQAMNVALTDLDRYKSLHGITQDYLLKIGDLNHDLQITNADLQPLLGLLGLGGGAGGIETVPEPASVLLLAFGGLAFAVTIARRTGQSNGTSALNRTARG
jgi:hypothetical protein